MKEKKTSVWQVVIYIALFVVLIYLCVAMFNSGSEGKQISQTEFYSLLSSDDAEGGEIQSVYAQGGTVYVLKKGSEIEAKRFPSYSDYYFTYSTSEELEAISGAIKSKNEAIATFNEGKADEDKISSVSYSSEVQGESFISKILPFLSILIVLFIGFMIFRMLSKTNSGTMNFAKSRARTGENIKVKFSDVAGAEEEKEELREVVEFLKSPQKFTDLGARIPKGILLVGAPGTGKTLLARAVAGESNVPFFSISGSDFVEMFVGVGAARVRDLFDTAKKNMPCIVFIDEIDAVGRRRGAGQGGGNDEREQTLNQLLVEMDGFEANEGIIVMAATNRSDVLDPALMRPGRFDRQIYVNVPDVKGRESIIKIHAKNKPMSEDINYTTLARITTGFTGADLENMLNEAAILAARSNRAKIIMSDVTEGINKVIMGPQKKSRVATERDQKITAYHEAGHAILGKKLEFCDEVQEVSIIPRGQAAGYTMSRPDNDDNHMTKNKINDLIAMSMGGRIAEEIVFGDISTGASADIDHATEMAKKMVTIWGMGKLGFVKFGSDEEIFIGRDFQIQKGYSEKIAAEIDEEIKDISNENYKRAKKILTDSRDLLDEMAKLLLMKNTIYSEDVKMLLAGKNAEDVAKEMDKREKAENKRQEKAKQEAKENRAKKDIEIKLKTAEILVKAGVISNEEFQQLKNEAELSQANQEALKLKKNSKEPSRKTTSKSTEVKVKEKDKTEKKKTESSAVAEDVQKSKKETDDKGAKK